MKLTWMTVVLLLSVATTALAGPLYLTSTDVGGNGGYQLVKDKLEASELYAEPQTDLHEGSNGGVWIAPSVNDAAWTHDDNAISVSDPTNPVPEPTTILLFGTGLAIMGIMRRHRSS